MSYKSEKFHLFCFVDFIRSNLSFLITRVSGVDFWRDFGTPRLGRFWTVDLMAERGEAARTVVDQYHGQISAPGY